MIYIHDITIESKDEFAQQFNYCSSIWKKYEDTEDEEVLKQFIAERQRLELGL